MPGWTRDQKISLLGFGVGVVALLIGAISAFSTTQIEGDVRVIPFTDQADNFSVSFAFSSFGVTAVGVKKEETETGGTLQLSACPLDDELKIDFRSPQWVFLSSEDEKRFTAPVSVPNDTTVDFIIGVQDEDQPFSVLEEWKFGAASVDRIQRVVTTESEDCVSAREALEARG